MIKKDISSVHMAGGYGGKVTINVYNNVGEILKIEADDLCQFLKQYLNQLGYDPITNLRQKFKRIVLTQPTCESKGCKEPAMRPYCWCLKHHNERANNLME